MNSLDIQNRYLNVKVFFLSAFLLLSSIVSAQDAVTLSWSDAIDLALKANPNLAAAQANLDVSKKNVAIARAGYLPQFGFGGSITESKSATFSETAGVLPSTTGMVGAAVTQMIYNRNTLGNHKIQQFLYASDIEQFRNSQYATISAAAQAYIGALVANDLLQIQRINLAVTEKNLEVSEYRVEVGATDVQEVTRWQIQKYSNMQDITSQEASLMKSHGTLNQVLNLPIEEDDVLETLTIEKDGFIFSSPIIAEAVAEEGKAHMVRDYLVEIGLAKSPQLASLNQQVEAQNKQLHMDKLWVAPSLNFQAGADAKWLTEGDGDDASQNSDVGFWQVGVKMSWPLVAGGANITKVKQARSQLSAIEYQRNNLQTSLELNIRSIVALVSSDFLNIGYARSQTEAATLNYELVLENYYVGESTLLDLLDAQEQKLDSEIAAEIALYTFFLDLISLEQEIGYFTATESQEIIEKVILDLELRLTNE